MSGAVNEKLEVFGLKFMVIGDAVNRFALLSSISRGRADQSRMARQMKDIVWAEPTTISAKYEGAFLG